MGRGRSGIVNEGCELSFELVARISAACVGAVKQCNCLRFFFDMFPGRFVQVDMFSFLLSLTSPLPLSQHFCYNGCLKVNICKSPDCIRNYQTHMLATLNKNKQKLSSLFFKRDS